MTALFDATYDAIGSTLEYFKRLADQDFECNGGVYIIADWMDKLANFVSESASTKSQALGLGAPNQTLNFEPGNP